MAANPRAAAVAAPGRPGGGSGGKATKYSTHRFDDVNHKRLLRGEQLVWVGFTF